MTYFKRIIRGLLSIVAYPILFLVLTVYVRVNNMDESDYPTLKDLFKSMKEAWE